MIHRNFHLLTGLLLTLLSCSSGSHQKREINLIPLPNQMVETDAVFSFNQTRSIFVEQKELLEGIESFQETIERYAGNRLKIVDKKETASIVIFMQKHLPEEGYELDITNSAISIRASTPAGVFYAFQTVLQMCPTEVYTDTNVGRFKWQLPGVSIKDAPEFKWRGMMLDVSRHFFTKDEVMELIDYLAYHKINVFHWHLVDDQGWRIEIEKYPKLTETGAWRVDREHLPWNARSKQKSDEKASYGGFYTQQDIREVVAYAEKRFITVVPEIEMPGHTTSSLAAYPQFACTEGPFTVIPGGIWPITDIYCAGKDETFSFIEDVLTEVMELFPSKYIHIGGDEANKAEWKKCKKCQARIRKERLNNEDELQSYFIRRIEKFLSKNDRILLGWDEILEGGLAPGATVMSWRGFHGGIEAANGGHDVVMSPTSHCYLDYYQGPIDTEPEAFNGNVSVSKIYTFNPVPEELEGEAKAHVLGGQGNLWTEHVTTKEHMQYMSFPRMSALSEALWTNAKNKDWESFATRLESNFDTFKAKGLNFSESMYTVKLDTDFDLEHNRVRIELSTEAPASQIYYTLDGKQPTQNSLKYESPFELDKTTEIKAIVYKNGSARGKMIHKSYQIHKATAKNVEYIQPYSKSYPGSGESNLVNSLRGSRNHSDGKWQAFRGNDLELIIDLNKHESLNKIVVGCLHSTGSWIFLPKDISIFASDDKTNFQEIGYTKNSIPLTGESQIVDYEVKLDGTTARYVKVLVRSQGVAPNWHGANGQDVWLFVDEIILD